MAETSDFTLLVKLIRYDFHSAHRAHVFEVLKQFFFCRSGRCWQIFGVKSVYSENSRLKLLFYAKTLTSLKVKESEEDAKNLTDVIDLRPARLANACIFIYY
jgi:hypothetical protein